MSIEGAVIKGTERKRAECPKCHIAVTKIVALNDNGTGKKMCRHCKRKALEVQ